MPLSQELLTHRNVYRQKEIKIHVVKSLNRLIISTHFIDIDTILENGMLDFLKRRQMYEIHQMRGYDCI